MLVTGPDGSIVNDPVLLHVARTRWWMQLADSDAGLYALGVAAQPAASTSKSPCPTFTRCRSRARCRRRRSRSSSGPSIYDVKYYWIEEFEIQGIPVVISRTGWTAIPGFEVNLLDGASGDALWDAVAEAGEEFDIRPIAPCEARRIEGGIFNYGSDIRLGDTPFHVMGLERLVEEQPQDYIGKAALESLRASGRRSQARRHRAGGRRAARRDVGVLGGLPRRPRGRAHDGCRLVAGARRRTSATCGCRSSSPSRATRLDVETEDGEHVVGPHRGDPVRRPAQGASGGDAQVVVRELSGSSQAAARTRGEDGANGPGKNPILFRGGPYMRKLLFASVALLAVARHRLLGPLSARPTVARRRRTLVPGLAGDPPLGRQRARRGRRAAGASRRRERDLGHRPAEPDRRSPAGSGRRHRLHRPLGRRHRDELPRRGGRVEDHRLHLGRRSRRSTTPA